jgi:hypothetical protein
MITTVQFKTLDDLYAFYNLALFAGTLSDCIINMSRHSGTYGFFASGRWKAEDSGDRKLVHEISLNPDHLDRPFVQWHATLVHEMVHLWQEDHGHPSRGNYHNKEWAWKMEEVGLIPSETGQPGGKKTGQSMTHYVNPDGLFLQTFNRLTTETLEALKLKYLPAMPAPDIARPGRAGTAGTGGVAGLAGGEEGGEAGAVEKYNSKTKYSCPCGTNVWGRPGLKIRCGECDGDFQENG